MHHDGFGLYIFVVLLRENKCDLYLLLTDRVKSPGFPLEGLAKKLPSTPLLINKCSASTPWTLGWNHRLEDIISALKIGLKSKQLHW